MQESDIRVVRGVSIATIVLSILAILGCLLVIALFAFGGVVASDPSNFDGYVEYRDDSGMTNGLDAQYEMDAEETSALVTGVFGFLGVFAGLGLVLCVISLVAGIVGIRNCRNPQTVGKIFGWSIAGAICSILMGRLVSCILLVVNAVYANRLKKAAANPAMYAQPAYGYAPQGYAQPMQAQPFQPAAAPAQPYAPAQAASPVQPASPAQPQSPSGTEGTQQQ